MKHLEELGIGRPSTYAPTINVLQASGSGGLALLLHAATPPLHCLLF